jgi:hypothetical protein
LSEQAAEIRASATPSSTPIQETAQLAENGSQNQGIFGIPALGMLDSSKMGNSGGALGAGL